MSTIAFDTLKFAERLEAGGFTHEQAKTAAMAFAEASSEQNVATRGDVEILRRDLDAKLSETKTEILKWIFGTALAQVGAIVALLKLL
ncbi:DUF1640 domain-containing protein [Paramagnetospirillum kuznetsovii]|uniref:DUF1640 domain-containing protein n=1 Tax=Paramagnetospirillum kuznetsovii TaxID=2053833 RepID=A0A364NW92_9PROT|nr:DUF1640 domain-containing protein [Paramagnetospirillum kuznetsovii]RAU21326.1 DUF1640 domain-containing protein [Paramagnetospirillum kuznetsovii]